jgi:hypothetical protein
VGETLASIDREPEVALPHFARWLRQRRWRAPADQNPHRAPASPPHNDDDCAASGV